MKKILITGASGNVGQVLSEGLHDKNYFLRLADVKKVKVLHKDTEFSQLDILDFDNLKKVMQDIDCIIHLAAIAQDDAWDKLEAINIRGTYNIFEAARIKKVKRIIFASSLEEKPNEVRHLSTWLSYPDLVHLVTRCIEAKYHFVTVYGVSNNTRSVWDNPMAKVIDYEPQDNAEIYANNPSLKEIRDEIGQQFQGGQFCSVDFYGDPSKID